MSKQYEVVASVSPSQTKDAYIYNIVPTTGNGLAAITSADELLIVDRETLSPSTILRLKGPPKRVSCLALGDSTGETVVCSGNDGSVSVFDVRTQSKVGHFNIDRSITALACQENMIAVGTELAHSSAIVSLWDRRQNRQLWQNAENNDDITALDFSSSRDNLLLSGEDDGLVSIFDTNVSEEDDSLLQAINHGPINKAGFLGPDRFFALSSDQNLAIHPVSTPDDNPDPPPTLIGDLRPLIPCEYAIDVIHDNAGFAIATGCNMSKSYVDIVEIHNALDPSATPSLGLTTKHTLQDAHGEEVVRAIYIAQNDGLIFTAGEDGQIKAFKPISASKMMNSSTKDEASKKGSGGRYKPY